MKFRIIAIGFVLTILTFSYYGDAKMVFTDIEVGTKTSDSTAQVSITNSQIQSGIISVLAPLLNATITNDAPYIVVNEQINYLVFKVNSANEGLLTVAIQLKLVGNVFKFLNKPGSQFHRCSSKTSCGCSFVFNESRAIIGCGCNGNKLTLDSCKHQFFPIR